MKCYQHFFTLSFAVIIMFFIGLLFGSLVPQNLPTLLFISTVIVISLFFAVLHQDHSLVQTLVSLVSTQLLSGHHSCFLREISPAAFTVVSIFFEAADHENPNPSKLHTLLIPRNHVCM